MAKGLTIDRFPLDLVEWLPETTTSHSDSKNTPSLRNQTTLCVIEPIQPYLTNLFEAHKQKSWADLFPPPGFYEQSDRFFYLTILPGVNAKALLENYDTMIEKLTLENIEYCPIEAEKLLECFETLKYLDSEIAKILEQLLRYSKA